MKRPTDAILQDLSRERNRLAQLDRARADALARLDSLRAELEESPTAAPKAAPVSMDEVPRTPREKVSLFRSLFRGRPDVFPTRFVARRTGKAGYAPACANKFKPGLCGLRTGGKCGDCSNQAFYPVDDGMVLDHLRGRHVMGVYPLLEDETCWLLAADFDGAGGKTTLVLSSRLAGLLASTPASNAPDQGTVPMPGSSSLHLFSQEQHATWVVT